MRKDSKGRTLRRGENQRRDGRYVYQYTDIYGIRRCVYAWRLTEADKTPSGKKFDFSLREKEKQIQRDLDEGIDIAAANVTLNDYLQSYVSQKSRTVRRTTAQNYMIYAKKISKYSIGCRRLCSIKPADVRKFYWALYEDGVAYRYITELRSFAKIALNVAVNDDLIRKNPFSVKLDIPAIPPVKKALTREEMQKFIEFLQRDQYGSRIADQVIFLCNTGLRISEYNALTFEDVDFEHAVIHVNKQLLRDWTNGNAPYIQRPKTKSGVRDIPMNQEASSAMQRILSNRKTDSDPIVEGITGFLILTREGTLQSSENLAKKIRMARNRYNKQCETGCEIYVSPHILRHTFCTRLFETGVQPKVIQYIMGHSNLGVTMDVYTHTNPDFIRKQMEDTGFFENGFTSDFTSNA